jgi:hypothetical protein
LKERNDCATLVLEKAVNSVFSYVYDEPAHALPRKEYELTAFDMSCPQSCYLCIHPSRRNGTLQSHCTAHHNRVNELTLIMCSARERVG